MQTSSTAPAASTQERLGSLIGVMSALKNHPRSTAIMCVEGLRMKVKLLKSGFLEVDGHVPPVPRELELELAICKNGARLDPIPGMRSSQCMQG